MREQRATASTWRIGIDLAAFVVLAVIAGIAAAVTLAGVAILLTGAGANAPAPRPEAPVQAPAARTMVAESRQAH